MNTCYDLIRSFSLPFWPNKTCHLVNSSTVHRSWRLWSLTTAFCNHLILVWEFLGSMPHSSLWSSRQTPLMTACVLHQGRRISSPDWILCARCITQDHCLSHGMCQKLPVNLNQYLFNEITIFGNLSNLEIKMCILFYSFVIYPFGQLQKDK